MYREGASEGTDDFWEKHVPDNAVRRYGNLCLSVQEKRNLFNHIVQHSIMLNILGNVYSEGLHALFAWSNNESV